MKGREGHLCPCLPVESGPSQDYLTRLHISLTFSSWFCSACLVSVTSPRRPFLFIGNASLTIHALVPLHFSEFSWKVSMTSIWPHGKVVSHVEVEFNSQVSCVRCCFSPWSSAWTIYRYALHIFTYRTPQIFLIYPPKKEKSHLSGIWKSGQESFNHFLGLLLCLV